MNKAMGKERTKNFSKNLKTLRLNFGLTQEEMSYILSLKGKSSYKAYEDGRAEPKINGLIKMSEIFKTTIDEIVFGDIKLIPYSEEFKKEIAIKKLNNKIDRIKATIK